MFPERVFVSHPKACLLLMEETKTVWEVREWFNIKGEQRIEGPPASAYYVVDVLVIENHHGSFEPLHVRHFGNVGMVAFKKLTILEGNWLQVPTFPTWGQLFLNTLAGENACRLWFIWKSILQGKLARRTVETKNDGWNNDGWNLFLNDWEYGKVWIFKQVPGNTIFSLLHEPAVLGPFRVLLLARSFSVPVGKKGSHLAKDCWFSGALSPDMFVEFLLLRKGDTEMRKIAQPMSNCANRIQQNFKDFQRDYGVGKCVQICIGKKDNPFFA